MIENADLADIRAFAANCRSLAVADRVDVLERCVRESDIDKLVWYATLAATDANLLASHVMQLLAEVERLTTRQAELLATIVRLTNETPFPDEVKGWTAQRAAMVAEIGTLRAMCLEQRTDLLAETDRVAAERDAARSALAAAESTTEEQIATWLDGKAEHYSRNRNIGPYSSELAAYIRSGLYRASKAPR